MKKKSPFSDSSRQHQLESPDHIKDYVRVTSVSPFLIGSAILLLIVAFVVWGVLGTVTDRVSYSGLIFPHHGTDDVTLDSDGTIIKMFVHTGDTVTEGQPVARVLTEGRDTTILSDLDGTVLHTKQERDTFEPLEPLVSLVCEHKPDNSVHTMMVAYVDMATQHDLRVGMEAQVWPMGDERDEIGYVRGTITSIDRYPTPQAEIVSQLKSTPMAEALYNLNAPAYQVIIELGRNPDDPTLYDWSFGQPANVDMGIGTYCNVLTETRRRPMYQYLFNIR